MHTCMNTYIHTCVRACMQASMHPSIHTYIHMFVTVPYFFFISVSLSNSVFIAKQKEQL